MANQWATADSIQCRYQRFAGDWHYRPVMPASRVDGLNRKQKAARRICMLHALRLSRQTHDRGGAELIPQILR
jgi:hypothetical protein